MDSACFFKCGDHETHNCLHYSVCVGEEVRRVAQTVFMVTLFFILVSTEADMQIEEFIPYIPDSSQVGLIYWKQSQVSYIDITIEFPDTGFNISTWGTPTISGRNISVDAEIWRWTGLSFPVITTVSHTYNLGDSLCGEYNFDFKVWESSIRDIAFLVSLEITVPDDYPTIQEAINAASNGDTISVRNGTYYENIAVDKSISLRGEDRNNTIIDGAGGSHVVNITSNNVTLTNFTIRNGITCIILWSNSNRIEHNRISGPDPATNFWGIYFAKSNNNSIIGNIVQNCDQAIFLESASYNTIALNHVAHNYLGIRIDRMGTIPVLPPPPPPPPSWYNRIYQNNIMDNNYQTWGDPFINFWDNGYEGNYWSDYDERYLNASYNKVGISDTPYVIQGNNQDEYPLRNPHWNPADTNHDLKVDIFDIVLGASCFCMEWQDHYVYVDVAKPYGIIDIFDIVMIASHYGDEYTP